jgi:hypothetical protein
MGMSHGEEISTIEKGGDKINEGMYIRA